MKEHTVTLIFLGIYYVATHVFAWLYFGEKAKNKDYARMMLAVMDENRRMAMDQLTDDMIHDMNQHRTSKDLVN